MANIKTQGINVLKDQIKNENKRQVIRFGIVGVLNTGVDYAVFSLCVKLLGLHFVIGQILGPAFGILNSFILNRLWTFKDTNKSKKTHQQLMQFVLVNGISIAITMAALWVLIDKWGIDELWAKAAVIPVTQVVNFLGYKLWVFKKS